MADIAASVLARLKNKAKESAEAISFVCSSSARKNFCAVWKKLNMQKILSLKEVRLSIPLPILTAE